LVEDKKKQRTRLIWAILLCIGFPFAIIYPFVDAFILKHMSTELPVAFEFSAGLLSTSSILFGFSTLNIVSKEWVDRRVWAVVLPPLALIILSGVSISNLALGAANPVQVLVLCSATFNANVVSTGFIVGYITLRLPSKGNV
jgi:hypothetical protein